MFWILFIAEVLIGIIIFSSFYSRSALRLREAKEEQAKKAQKTDNAAGGDKDEHNNTSPPGENRFDPESWMRLSFVLTAEMIVFAALGVALLGWRDAFFFVCVPALVIGFCANIIPQRHVAVVECFGIYIATLPRGYYLLVPVIFTIRKSIFIGARTLRLWLNGIEDERDGKIRTRVEVQNDTIGVKAELIIQIDQDKDPTSAFESVYNVDDLIPALLVLVEGLIRAKFGAMGLDDVIKEKERSAMEKDIQDSLEKTLADWGAILRRFIITDVELEDGSIKARRERLLALTKSQADELLGKGEGARIRAAREGAGLEPEQVVTREVLLAQMEAFKTGKAVVVVNPIGGEGGPISIAGLTTTATRIFEHVRSKKKEEEDNE